MPPPARPIERLALVALSLLLSPVGAARELPSPAPVPGGIVVLPIQAPPAQRPVARFQGRRVMVLRDGGIWIAIVGIPLELPPGEQALEVELGGQQSSYRFTIEDKTYASQHLTIEDRRKVEPSAADLARIERETRIIAGAKARWTEADEVPLKLSFPVQGQPSSPFGLRRFFNGQARRPHAGLDIAAPQGTAVVAAAPGRAIATGDFFFNGRTVFIDHGQGFITLYCHLQRIDVQPDQAVASGQRIGLVGMTGRATGPHLHLGAILNQTLVDPALLLPNHRPLR